MKFIVDEANGIIEEIRIKIPVNDVSGLDRLRHGRECTFYLEDNELEKLLNKDAIIKKAKELIYKPDYNI